MLDCLEVVSVTLERNDQRLCCQDNPGQCCWGLFLPCQSNNKVLLFCPYPTFLPWMDNMYEYFAAQLACVVRALESERSEYLSRLVSCKQKHCSCNENTALSIGRTIPT